MADPQDMDEILRQIRGQLRADVERRSPKPPRRPTTSAELEARLKEIRGPAGDRAALAGFAASFIGPAMGAVVLTLVVLALG